VSTLPLPGVDVPAYTPPWQFAPRACRLTENVWGLDVSTRRIAVGVIQGVALNTEPEVGWFSHEVEQFDKNPARRLARMLETLPAFLDRLGGVAPPVAVLVEQPYGQGKSRPHPQSYYVVGVTLALLGQAFPDARIDVVEPTSWKRDALGEGKGFAKKPVLLAWARTVIDYPGDCRKCHGEGKGACDEACRAHDEADAIGVATCAAIRWSRDRRLR
jgi:hypothetical protein